MSAGGRWLMRRFVGGGLGGKASVSVDEFRPRTSRWQQSRIDDDGRSESDIAGREDERTIGFDPENRGRAGSGEEDG